MMEGGLTTVLLLLAGSLAAVALFKSMGLPALMGYLLVGVAVGPHALGLMPEEGGAAVLAEFGVVFLMFSIGLEFSLAQLNAMRRVVLGLGALQVLVTHLVFTLIGWALGLSLLAAWARGGALTNADLRQADWVFREPGSGTREAFLAALAARGLDVAALKVALTLPSNEAVREAVAEGAGAGCLSPLVCVRALAAGALKRANILLPPRPFQAVWHKERYMPQAAAAFLELARTAPRVIPS
jgi:DNA-binding transcriptional LysR family regulator